MTMDTSNTDTFTLAAFTMITQTDSQEWISHPKIIVNLLIVVESHHLPF